MRDTNAEIESLMRMALREAAVSWECDRAEGQQPEPLTELERYKRALRHACSRVYFNEHHVEMIRKERSDARREVWRLREKYEPETLPQRGGLPLRDGDDDGPEGRQAAFERMSDEHERNLRDEERGRW